MSTDSNSSNGHRITVPAIWKSPKRDSDSCAPPQNHFHPKPTDIFVTPDTIHRNFLREGSLVVGPTQPPHRGTSPQLKTVEKVNDMPFRGLHQGGPLREPDHD